MIGLDCGSE